jgi:hypothetical protein
MQLVLDGAVVTPRVIQSSPTLPYLAGVIGLIEGRPLRPAELAARLLRALRQHSIAFRTRKQYVRDFLLQHPP